MFNERMLAGKLGNILVIYEIKSRVLNFWEWEENKSKSPSKNYQETKTGL